MHCMYEGAYSTHVFYMSAHMYPHICSHLPLMHVFISMHVVHRVHVLEHRFLYINLHTHICNHAQYKIKRYKEFLRCEPVHDFINLDVYIEHVQNPLEEA